MFTGYELLSCHVDTAQQLASRFQVGAPCTQRLGQLSKDYQEQPCSIECSLQVPGVSFHAKDMLKSDLGNTSIVMLASFCWDRALYKQAAAKLSKELMHGSIVMDYSAQLDEHFQQIARVQIPVSWNDQQTMYVYLKP